MDEVTAANLRDLLNRFLTEKPMGAQEGTELVAHLCGCTHVMLKLMAASRLDRLPITAVDLLMMRDLIGAENVALLSQLDCTTEHTERQPKYH